MREASRETAGSNPRQAGNPARSRSTARSGEHQARCCHAFPNPGWCRRVIVGPTAYRPGTCDGMPFVRRHHVGCVPLGHDELTLTTDDLGPRPSGVNACEPGPFSTLHGVVFDVLGPDPAVVNSRRVMQAGTTDGQIALPAILTINAISA